jgi:Domain of unknown function (DUF4386)
MTAPWPLARITGLLYLVTAVGGVFAIFVRGRVVESGDAAATADNIRASAMLFRAGFLSNLVASICFLLTVMALYLLLKHVHGLVAAAMVTTVAVSVAIACLNLLNWYTALSIATDGHYAATFGAAQADRMVMLYVDAEYNGGNVAYVFFALWLVPLGYLVIRSGYVPKVLGVALIVGCCSYLARVFTDFLAHDAAAGILPVIGAAGGLSELAFAVWLLVKGVRVPAAAVGSTAKAPQPLS